METISLDKQGVLRLLPDRDDNGHKGNYGKILLLCGSKGYTGAAYMATMGALRTGAGLVYLGVPECIYGIEAVKLNEPVVFPLPDQDGTYSIFSQSEILSCLQGKDAVLIGPGIGKSQGALMAVKTVLENFDGPVVLDADGINHLSLHKDMVRDRTGITILTPHEGEFKRMGGELSLGRIQSAIHMAKDLGAMILLKGHETIITDGDRVYVNKTGNPGMAVGGSGDLLAGMIVSLLGQKIPPLEAAACGAWLHGAAGDLCATQMGQYSMLPTDMLNVLPQLLK